MNTPNYQSIALIRLSALGDIVHTIPAFTILRHRFPNARISWFAEPAGAKLLENVAHIDQIVVTHLKSKGLSNKLKDLKRLLHLYKNTFDLVLDFQGLLKSAVLSHLLKGDILGFGKNNLKESQARFFYTRTAPVFDETRHVIYKNIHLVNQLSTHPTPQNEPIAYPLKELTSTPTLASFMNDNGLHKKNYIVLNVGGGWESKLLSPQQLMEIVNHLKNKYPMVILWGNPKEKETATQIAAQTGTTASAFFNFPELIQFIRDARMIITGDTLALHIADMVQTPSVGIFGPTSPQRNGSLLESSHAVFEKLNCGFCYKKKCGTIDCIKKINIAKIIESVELINEKFN